MPHLNSPNSDISIESTSRISSSNKDPHTVDGILKDVVKPFGIWQFIVLMLSVWSDVPAAIFPIFGNSVPSKFHCQMEPNIQKELLFDQTNVTLTGLSLHRIKGPLEISDNKYGVPFGTVAAAIGPWGNQTATPGCHRYKRNYTRIGRLQELFLVTESTSVKACPQGYVCEMDKYQYPLSIVIEWDLVCDKEWLAPLSTSMYMLGMVPGFWIVGITADSIGRKATTFAFWALQVVFGISCSFAPNFITYAVLRFVLGLASVARANALLVLSVELTIAKYGFVVPSSMCIVQSPIKTTLEDFCKHLSLIIAEEEENEVSKEAPQTYYYRFFDQLRQPYCTLHLAKVSLIATFSFNAQAACLFGMLLYARTVRVYVYLVALANNFTGIPGAGLSAVLYAKIRRCKLPLMMTYICSAFCLALGGICDDIVRALYSNLGLILCTAISNMVFTCTPEIFPSCIRSQGLGNAAGLGRFGAAWEPL
ncbi:solute carrier family 22 [Echinococcus multilocularis]|uniref:Solute carrier family 22 n=1 Tax=Echinococcus multilocularis TaxID=6211 RepID=A0A068YJ67_ECHMU|nr:solute carrier family 22 [Echinococcus multilocularis]